MPFAFATLVLAQVYGIGLLHEWVPISWGLAVTSSLTILALRRLPFLVIKEEFIAHTRRRPVATLCEAFDADAGDGMRASVFPGIAITRGQGFALLGIQASSDHWQETKIDCVEYFVDVEGASDANICTGGNLHWY